MKRSWIGLLLIFMIVAAWIYSRPSVQFSAEKPVEEPSSRIETTTPVPSKALVRSVESEEKVSSLSTSTSFSEDDFLRLYNSTDFTRSMPTARLVETLEENWDASHAGFFINMLERMGSGDPNERGRLVFLANEVRSKDFVPFWTQVLTRKPAGFENEAELIKAVEPNVSSLSLRNELSTAIRNLGLLAYKDEGALNVLRDYMRTHEPTFENAIFRKDAYYRMREVNPTLAARSLMTLAKDDPLRALLSLD